MHIWSHSTYYKLQICLLYCDDRNLCCLAWRIFFACSSALSLLQCSSLTSEEHSSLTSREVLVISLLYFLNKRKVGLQSWQLVRSQAEHSRNIDPHPGITTPCRITITAIRLASTALCGTGCHSEGASVDAHWAPDTTHGVGWSCHFEYWAMGEEERQGTKENDPLGVYMTLLAAPAVGDQCSFQPLNTKGWYPLFPLYPLYPLSLLDSVDCSAQREQLLFEILRIAIKASINYWCKWCKTLSLRAAAVHVSAHFKYDCMSLIAFSRRV